MKEIEFFKAQGREVESIAITIKREVETANLSLAELGDFFKSEASSLANILFDTLPGGTIDHLLAEMMKRRASLFIVPFTKKEERK